jgi:cold shock CspA family protein
MTAAAQNILTGIVKRFNGERGFIAESDGYRNNIFFHVSQLVDQGCELRKGVRVTFVEDVDRDGRPYARQIVVVRDEQGMT